MACFHPIQAYRVLGHKKLVFSPHPTLFSTPIKIPCSQCVGCRIERSRQWAVRCMHEASLHTSNCFITLTYSDQHLPADRSLDVRVFQLFMKRLRKRFGSGIRFYHCGEYGSKFGRPHYHACLFGFDFADKYIWKEDNGCKLYRSPSLEELWPYGYSSIGSLTYQSAAYVARYILKKITGDQSSSHYSSFVNPSTGEVFSVRPEYTTMSRRPGIAKDWIETYMDDVYPKDEVIVKGRKLRPPRYYDNQYEFYYPSDLQNLKNKRKRNSRKYSNDNTPERLSVREQCLQAKLATLPRVVDSEI